MKANDLRIGNLVYTRQDKVTNATITGIQLLLDFEIEKYDDTPPYKPIKLNADWLLKLGFEKIDNNGYYRKKVEVHTSCNDDIHCVIIDTEFFMVTLQRFEEEKYVNTNVDMKYVHQLQNLFFALTGEELTIKNEPVHI